MGAIDNKIKQIDKEIAHNAKLQALLKYSGEDRIIDSKEKIAYLEELQKNIPNISIKSILSLNNS